MTGGEGNCCGESTGSDLASTETVGFFCLEGDPFLNLEDPLDLDFLRLGPSISS